MGGVGCSGGVCGRWEGAVGWVRRGWCCVVGVCAETQGALMVRGLRVQGRALTASCAITHGAGDCLGNKMCFKYFVFLVKM